MLKIELELTENEEEALKGVITRELQRHNDNGKDDINTAKLCYKICKACRIATEMKQAEMN
jgi:hypothetical protein